MKYRFMVEHREEHCVGKMAEMLGVARSGFYAWLGEEEESPRVTQEKDLVLREALSLWQRPSWSFSSVIPFRSRFSDPRAKRKSRGIVH